MEGGGACYNHFYCLSVLLSVLLVWCLVARGYFWGAAHVKRLEELLTRQILVPSYGIFSSRFFCFSVLVRCLIGTFLVQADPPFSSNALSSGAIAEPSPASVLKNCWSGRFLFRLTASSRSNFLHPERLLDGAVCFFHWQIFCYRSKICPSGEPGKQMASTEDPRKRKKLIAPGGNWTRIAQLRIRRSTSRPRVWQNVYCFVLLSWSLNVLNWFNQKNANNNWLKIKLFIIFLNIQIVSNKLNVKVLVKLHILNVTQSLFSGKNVCQFSNIFAL